MSALPAMPRSLRSILIARGLAAPKTIFQPLSGGRTNALWRFESKEAVLVCKRYAGTGTPLFANSVEDEARALTVFEPEGLAPRLIARISDGAADSLIYTHVDGPMWQGDVAYAAQALSRVHQRARVPGFRSFEHCGAAFLREAEAMASAIAPHARGDLHRVTPRLPDQEPAARAAMLHGDPVPANLIETPRGPTFVDWQCPGIGDPAADIAVFLSPAMQSLYGGRGLTPTDRDAFFAAYGDPQVLERYAAMAPVYHYRIAAHCLWRAHRGAADYASAAALELSALAQKTAPAP